MHSWAHAVQWVGRRTGLLVGVTVVAATLAACSSTASSTGTTTGSTDPVPASAFSDHTGVTPTSVTVANITTQTAGLFTGPTHGYRCDQPYFYSG